MLVTVKVDVAPLTFSITNNGASVVIMISPDCDRVAAVPIWVACIMYFAERYNPQSNPTSATCPAAKLVIVVEILSIVVLRLNNHSAVITSVPVAVCNGLTPSLTIPSLLLPM